MKQLLSLLGLLLVLHTSAQERLPQFLQHTVKDGETISSIAAEYRVNAKDMLLLNNFPNDKVVVTDEVILIRQLTADEASLLPMRVPEKSKPVAAKTSAPAASSPSVSASKREEEKPVASSKAAVSSSKQDLIPGTIPASTKAVEVGPGGTKYNVTKSEFHTVERGQTFYRIALIYGLSIDELKSLNNLSGTTIEIGQRLRVR